MSNTQQGKIHNVLACKQKLPGMQNMIHDEEKSKTIKTDPELIQML